MLTNMASVDGSGFLLFFRHLSQLYQGLRPIDPPAYHEPEAIKFTEPLKTPSPPYDRYDLSAPLPWEQPELRAPEFVAFRLTDTQLTEIHNSVTKGIENPRITRMDAAVGLFARCLLEVEPESKPIDTISYLINVRAFLASPVPRLNSPKHRGMGIYPVNAAVNATVFLPIGLQPSKGLNPHDDVLACAVEIRKSLEKLKDPKSVKDLVTDFAKMQSQTAWDKSGQGPPKEGCLFVNVIRR